MGAPHRRNLTRREAWQELKQQIHQALLREVDLVSASGAHTDWRSSSNSNQKSESITSDLIAEHGFDGSAEELAELRGDTSLTKPSASGTERNSTQRRQHYGNHR